MDNNKYTHEQKVREDDVKSIRSRLIDILERGDQLSLTRKDFSDPHKIIKLDNQEKDNNFRLGSTIREAFEKKMVSNKYSALTPKEISYTLIDYRVRKKNNPDLFDYYNIVEEVIK